VKFLTIYAKYAKYTGLRFQGDMLKLRFWPAICVFPLLSMCFWPLQAAGRNCTRVFGRCKLQEEIAHRFLAAASFARYQLQTA